MPLLKFQPSYLLQGHLQTAHIFCSIKYRPQTTSAVEASYINNNFQQIFKIYVKASKNQRERKNIHLTVLAGDMKKQVGCKSEVTFIVWNRQQSTGRHRLANGEEKKLGTVNQFHAK